MSKILDKILLTAICSIIILTNEVSRNSVILLLTAISVSGIGIYFDQILFHKILYCVLFLLALLFPQIWVLTPFVLYDLIWDKTYKLAASFGVVIVFIRIVSTENMNAFGYIMILLSIYLAYFSSDREYLKMELIRQHDQSTELQILLKEKNRSLIEKQDHEVYLATLQERNRIAREIHDNVGHLLSRALLQLGAILAISTDNLQKQQLNEMKSSLNHAMNSIRESVHDLHDESLNLEIAVTEAVKVLPERFHVISSIDISEKIPRNIKYTLIAVVKEGVSNIAKHSNGEKVSIILREHPGFYQLSIEDDGTKVHRDYKEGIGLTNIKDRIDAVHGSMKISKDKGFQIFITIQKTGEHE